MLAALALLEAASFTLPATTPLYCASQPGEEHVMPGIDFGTLRLRALTHAGLRTTLVATNGIRGTLELRGGKDDRDVYMFDVSTKARGMALVALRIRLDGRSQDLDGAAMCRVVERFVAGEARP